MADEVADWTAEPPAASEPPMAWTALEAEAAGEVYVVLAAAGSERPDSGSITSVEQSPVVASVAGVDRPDGWALQAATVAISRVTSIEGVEPPDRGTAVGLLMSPVRVQLSGTEPPDRGSVAVRAIGAPQLDAAQQASLLFDPPALKLPHETLVYPFDFSQDLLPDETIAAFISMTVESPGGLDPQPDNVRMGPPQVAPTALFQFATDGINGVNYLFSALVRTSRQRVLESEVVVRVREAVGRPTRRS